MKKTTPKERIGTVIADLGLEFFYEFVPFTQSRNAGNKQPSLNWIVTLKCGNRHMSFGYSAGCGHCPANKLKWPNGSGTRNRLLQEAIATECRKGFAARYVPSTDHIIVIHSKPILPDTADIIHSLAIDASVLDSGSFEEWASEFGYDTDSRSTEGIYNACVKQSLQLRRLIGDSGLHTLQEASQDY